MNSAEFRRRQRKLGWTNKKVADYLRKSEQTVSNWRNDRQSIPAHVEVMLNMAEEASSAAESVQVAG